MPLSMMEHTPTSSSSTLAIVATDTLPPLPKIQSAQTRKQIFTHSSMTPRRRGEFEAPRDNPSRDNEELAHIGDQVVSLAVTDLIQGHHPRLRVGPTSANQKLRDRIKCGGALSEIAVRYGLHESLRTQAPHLKDSQGVQVDVFKAYVGGLFREQGMDVVKQWLDPLFRPHVDVAYLAERRDHLVPAPAAPATTSRTSPQRGTPAPSSTGRAGEILSQASVDRQARSRATTARNSPGQAPSVAVPLRRETDRSNSGRKRRASLQDGGSGDADAHDSQYANRPTSASPRRRSPATAGLAERSTRKRHRSK